MGWLWTLIVGGVIGAIAGAITNRDLPAGIIGNIIAGLVGASLGQWLLGSWGPSLAGMAVVPAILGAVILVLIISAIFGMQKRHD
ncbi:membrane protein [Furfurilactobacillus sp. OKN36]